MGKGIINNNLQPNKNLQITNTMTKERKKIMQQMIFIMKDSKNNSVDIENLLIIFVCFICFFFWIYCINKHVHIIILLKNFYLKITCSTVNKLLILCIFYNFKSSIYILNLGETNLIGFTIMFIFIWRYFLE